MYKPVTIQILNNCKFEIFNFQAYGFCSKNSILLDPPTVHDLIWMEKYIAGNVSLNIT